MYPLGVLSGLGFDTATEIGLLILAWPAARSIFRGMTSHAAAAVLRRHESARLKGCFMNFTYGWVFSKPVRKVYYKHHRHRLSVAVAWPSAIELASIVMDKLRIDSGPLAAVGNRDLDNVGYAIVGYSSSPGLSRWSSGGTAASKRNGQRDWSHWTAADS